MEEDYPGISVGPGIYLTIVNIRDRPIIGFTDLFNRYRYRYRLIGIDTHHIGIGKIGIGIGLV